MKNCNGCISPIARSWVYQCGGGPDANTKVAQDQVYCIEQDTERCKICVCMR